MKASIHILWLCFIAAAFASCAKDDNNCDPDDKESPCYAVGPGGGSKFLLVEAKTNGKTSAVYEYDNQNRATVIKVYSPEGALELTTTYTYQNHGFPSVVQAKNKDGKIAMEEYTFGSDGKPVSMVLHAPGDSKDIPLDYQFSYSNNKLVETIIAREEEPSIYVNTYTYDGNGNLLSIEYSVDGQWGATVEQGNFDDKIAVGLHGNPLAWKFPGANNHQTLKATSAILGVTTDQTWKYTYDNAGYPLTAEIYDSGSDVAAETHTYHYKPAK